MTFYERGDKSKTVMFLVPGICCLYSSFDHVLCYHTKKWVEESGKV